MVDYTISLFTDYDIYLFKEGMHFRLFDKMGAHLMGDGAYFALWAPNASYVSVVGDFNNYDVDKAPLKLREDGSGIWEGFVKSVKKGDTYKYFIRSRFDKRVRYKVDPFAFFAEKPPKSASVVWDLDEYEFEDGKWMSERNKLNDIHSPISIYEVHLGSWKKKSGNNEEQSNYAQKAEELSAYLNYMNYTHIELLPITEYPFDGSWGYQVIGYFAPTSRYGTPQDFMRFVDIMHQNNIGVILDWVPSHFVLDDHGLANFDGTCLYEHEDPKKGYHPQWNSAIFNYGRNEVRAFLISSAVFWLEKYHIDGLRVDGVASMLYLDFARENGQWIPNKYGGRENLEAIEFLKQLNKTVYGTFNGIMTIAEESSAFPKVSWPVYAGGLGFGFKWNMGWMHDTLDYFKVDPIYRQHHHNNLTFSIWYAFSENFILPLSHDEVVHMKGSLINKMPGDYENKFANLRALFGYMMAHPGKKLLFSGGEFAQFKEWNYNESLDWSLLEIPKHKGIQRLVADLNKLYQTRRALYFYDSKPEGFEWIDVNNNTQNIVSFLRKSERIEETIAVVCNFSGKELNYTLALPFHGSWQEIFNSQLEKYGGWHKSALRKIFTSNIPYFGRDYSVNLALPPLSVSYFEYKPD